MKKLIWVTILMLSLSFFGFAQDNSPIAILEYADDEFEIEIIAPDGSYLDDFYLPLEIGIGYTVITYDTTAEIRLEPNGSIFKLSADTDFKINELATDDESTTNAFAMINGKIRTIAAKMSGDQRYKVSTQSAVCGVRGTDFITDSASGVTVAEGLVDIINVATNDLIQAGAGTFVDTLSDTFSSVALSAAQLAEKYSGMDFAALDPANVGSTLPTEETEETEDVDTEIVEAPTDEETDETTDAGEDDKAGIFDPLLEKLKDFLGMEIGTITIDGTTYSKAVLQPTFAIGDLKMSLYLPVIYESNMFDPNDWYHPKGNDEWSFGFDEEFGENALGERVLDFANDLFLKIRYIQWGEQRDEFYFKIGNLSNMSIGHGILMNNFANDADFPAIRNLGLNMGLDLGKFGFEVVANQLPIPSIAGARFYFRPIGESFPMAIGLSSIVDVEPDADLPEDEDHGDPIFITTAFDIDFPVFENDLITIVLFSDLATMIPYYDGEIKFDTVLTKDSNDAFDGFRNYGIQAGIFGNILFVDYRLEYRNYNGTFRPAFFNSTYERMRGNYVLNYEAYLADPDNEIYNNTTMGIYGEAGFNIFDMVTVEAGYMWPWTSSNASDLINIMNDDFFHLVATIQPDVIPIVGIHGSFIYDRSGLVGSIVDSINGVKSFSLVDELTLVKGELIYPAADTLDIAVSYSTAFSRDAEGNVIYVDGTPDYYPVVSVETRIHF